MLTNEDQVSPELALFPCGENLSRLSTPTNTRGTLDIPLPFDKGDLLTLQWEQISNFVVDDEDFLYTWGLHHRGNRKNQHYLGKFFFNGVEMVREDLGPYQRVESYRECRFDHLGTDYTGTDRHFSGEHGFNCTQLMKRLPRSGKFNAQTPIEEILKIQYGRKGSYKLFWRYQDHNKRWSLKIDSEKYTTDKYGSVLLFIFTEYMFDFEKNVVTYNEYYGPNDLWTEHEEYE